MICPHCKEDSIPLKNIYWWPYGEKVCRQCNGVCKVKKMPLLAFVSVCLGIMAVLVTILLGNILWFIPAIIIVFILDATMDSKYRKLVVEDP
jgi:hypothetical protein